ncbi:hypothetical protein LYNGBM3L_15240 [Moorena producens 3L]|uniref:Uncharacterized protein n=1 Tax=Moorena producens 3L TaxID=489825 RepID=F4XLM4_9CYAN|nr:hypothetical protein LYNGBM3L_15240 [Moorena producens 3L]
MRNSTVIGKILQNNRLRCLRHSSIKIRCATAQVSRQYFIITAVFNWVRYRFLGFREQGTENRQEARGKRQEARGKRQEARGKRQEARGKRQEARGKRQEARGKRQEARGKRQEARGKMEKILCTS